MLTKRFLEVASTFPDGVLELNQVAAQLGVSKRRMYDITNVLEGVNLLQKQNKNVVLWKYVPMTFSLSALLPHFRLFRAPSFATPLLDLNF